jgi:hypothetical protein
MKTMVERDPKQPAQCVYSIFHGCSRNRPTSSCVALQNNRHSVSIAFSMDAVETGQLPAVWLSEHSHNPKQDLLEKSKLA